MAVCVETFTIRGADEVMAIYVILIKSKVLSIEVVSEHMVVGILTIFNSRIQTYSRSSSAGITQVLFYT